MRRKRILVWGLVPLVSTPMVVDYLLLKESASTLAREREEAAGDRAVRDFVLE